MQNLENFMKFKIAGLFIVCIWSFGLQTSYCQSFEEYKQAGDNYLRAGQPALAVSEYKKALGLEPASTAVYFNLAIAHYKERNLKETISSLEKLTQLNPNDYEAHYNLGCLKLYGRDFEAALDCFQRARICCNENKGFISTIDQTLEFMGKLQSLDPQTQDVILLSFAAQSLA